MAFGRGFSGFCVHHGSAWISDAFRAPTPISPLSPACPPPSELPLHTQISLYFFLCLIPLFIIFSPFLPRPPRSLQCLLHSTSHGCQWNEFYHACINADGAIPCRLHYEEADCAEAPGCEYFPAAGMCLSKGAQPPCHMLHTRAVCATRTDCRYNDELHLCYGRDEVLPCQMFFQKDSCENNTSVCSAFCVPLVFISGWS